MAKSDLRLKALRMRRNGSSIRDISRLLGVSKSTASLWCANTTLTPEQIEKLRQNSIKGGNAGRLKGAHMQKQRKLDKIKTYEREGLRVLGKISKRDLLLMGLGLHLGEGTKGGVSVRFTNSNPAIIQLFIAWAESAFGVRRLELYCRVMINEVHKNRESLVRKKWAELLKISPSQFRKTVFIKAKTQKVYENHNDFLGTLAVAIPKSSDLHYRILGLMRGLVYKLCAKRAPA